MDASQVALASLQTIPDVQTAVLTVFQLKKQPKELVKSEKHQLVGKKDVPDEKQTMHWIGVAVGCLDDPDVEIQRGSFDVLVEVVSRQIMGSTDTSIIRRLNLIHDALQDFHPGPPPV